MVCSDGVSRGYLSVVWVVELCGVRPSFLTRCLAFFFRRSITNKPVAGRSHLEMR
jgi:hypothetical protein